MAEIYATDDTVCEVNAIDEGSKPLRSIAEPNSPRKSHRLPPKQQRWQEGSTTQLGPVDENGGDSYAPSSPSPTRVSVTPALTPSPIRRQQSNGSMVSHSRARSVPEFSTPPHLRSRIEPPSPGTPTHSRGRSLGLARLELVEKLVSNESASQSPASSASALSSNIESRETSPSRRPHFYAPSQLHLAHSPASSATTANTDTEGSPVLTPSTPPRRHKPNNFSLTISPVLVSSSQFDAQRLLPEGNDGSPEAVVSVEVLMRRMAHQEQQIGNLKEALDRAQKSMSQMHYEWQTVLGQGPPQQKVKDEALHQKKQKESSHRAPYCGVIFTKLYGARLNPSMDYLPRSFVYGIVHGGYFRNMSIVTEDVD